MNWGQGDMIRHPVLGTYVFVGQRCGFLWFDHSTGISQLGLEASGIERKLNDPESKWVRVESPDNCPKCHKAWGKHIMIGTAHRCP